MIVMTVRTAHYYHQDPFADEFFSDFSLVAACSLNRGFSITCGAIGFAPNNLFTNNAKNVVTNYSLSSSTFSSPIGVAVRFGSGIAAKELTLRRLLGVCVGRVGSGRWALSDVSSDDILPVKVRRLSLSYAFKYRIRTTYSSRFQRLIWFYHLERYRCAMTWWRKSH